MLAQEWFYGLMTRPDMSIKVERQLHDMRILGRIVGVRSTEHLGPASFAPNIILILKLSSITKQKKYSSTKIGAPAVETIL